MRYVCLLASFVLLATGASGAIIGGIGFADNAFADTLVSGTGTFTTSGGPLASVLTDQNEGTYAFCGGRPSVCTLTLAFTDNAVINGPGVDLAVFELGAPDSFQITLNGLTNQYATVGTGFSADGFNLNVGQVDLSDFGYASNAQVTEILLRSVTANFTSPSFSLVGAVNSASPVPEPSTLWLTGVSGAVYLMRRRISLLRATKQK